MARRRYAFLPIPGRRIDAILMDVMMPVMDGLEATRRIRAMKRPDARTIPIIAMTANAFAEDRQLAFAAGMDMHIAKPLEARRMVETLERFVKSSRKLGAEAQRRMDI